MNAANARLIKMDDSQFAEFLEERPSRSGQGRRAVIVGLNYGWVKPGWKIPFLKGGVSDALRMCEVLIQFYGFQREEIRLLIDGGVDDSEPTRENVLAGLNWLTNGTSPGDTLVFYYGGHSAAVYAPHNSFRDNTLAGLCLVNGMVFTFEVWAHTSRLPAGCMITCIIDAPYGQFMLNVPANTPPEKPFSFAEDKRAALPGMRFLPARQPPNGFAVPNLAQCQLPNGVNGFIICACGMRDVAREMRAGLDGNSEPGGLFTLALCETMSKIAGKTCTVAGVYELVRQRMLGQAMQEHTGVQCPSLCWSPNCPPEQVSFIIAPGNNGRNSGRYVNIDDGHISSHRGLCCPSKSGKSRRSNP